MTSWNSLLPRQVDQSSYADDEDDGAQTGEHDGKCCTHDVLMALRKDNDDMSRICISRLRGYKAEVSFAIGHEMVVGCFKLLVVCLGLPCLCWV